MIRIEHIVVIIKRSLLPCTLELDLEAGVVSDRNVSKAFEQSSQVRRPYETTTFRKRMKQKSESSGGSKMC
jgi:hypothetical protein